MTTPITAEFLALQEILAGRYSIERELGRGGMGVVLLARDVALDRLVAIKVLPPDLAEVADVREQFLREARTAAGLSHPHIVPIHSVEEQGKFVFFVMGYVNGESLRERVERVGPLSPRQATQFMQEVAWALAYAHERGVVHRDIKPDNVMLERDGDRAIVMDFGIATVGPQRPSAEIIGTARYMSPEQASGEMVDRRSDLYSLGATFFYALTGRAPFQASSVPALLAKHVGERPPSLPTLRSEIPANLAGVVDRCLAKAPEDRFPSGDELAKALGDVRGREMRAPPLVRSFVRNAQVSTMVIFALLIGGSGGGGAGSANVAVNWLAIVMVVQLGVVGRRLLREGYTFPDIQTALQAEMRIQEEELDVTGQKKFMRWINSMWYKLWSGGAGRWFFKMAGLGLTPPAHAVIPSRDHTELVMGRQVTQVFEELPRAQRERVADLPDIVERLEGRAEALRARGQTGPELTNTVAALERVRLAVMQLRAGAGSVEDLTRYLQAAKAVGREVDRQLEAQAEVRSVLAK
ncbi:MAG: serine/threonine protein kinase [Gemmatimonadota bacterium]|nr:serine/threonine protein kinase [Gemmatimonadota bacterium]